MFIDLILGLSAAILAGSIIISYIYRSQNETECANNSETKSNDLARLSDYKYNS